MYPSDRGPVIAAILILNIPFLVAAYFLRPDASPSTCRISVLFDLLLSTADTCESPRPILDSAFNILYAFPGSSLFR